MSENKKFNLNRYFLVAADLYCDKINTSSLLSKVHVYNHPYKEGALYLGTNKHNAFVAWDEHTRLPEGVSLTLSIPKELGKGLSSRSKTADSDRCDLEVLDDTGLCVYTFETSTKGKKQSIANPDEKVLNQNYPDLIQAIRYYFTATPVEGAVVQGFQPQYLEILVKTSKILEPYTGNSLVKIKSFNSVSPIHVQFDPKITGFFFPVQLKNTVEDWSGLAPEKLEYEWLYPENEVEEQ